MVSERKIGTGISLEVINLRFHIQIWNLPMQPCFSHLFAFAYYFFPFSPWVTQLNQLQWSVLRSMPSWDHAPSTVLDLLRLKQTTFVWLVAEPRCRDGSTCQSRVHHASISPGAPKPKRNDGPVLHKYDIPSYRRPFNRNTLRPAAERGEEIQWSFFFLCVICVLMLVLVSCSPSQSLSVSRMISLTCAPQGLAILVISSTCRSIVAASGRPNNAERKNVIAMIHHCAHISGAWQDQSRKPAINKPMSGVRDSLEHLKWMRGIC